MIDFINFTSINETDDLRGIQYNEDWFVKNITKYSNIDFCLVTWPNAGNKMYSNKKIITHICENIIDVNVKEKDLNNNGCTLFQKIWTCNVNKQIVHKIINIGADITNFDIMSYYYKSSKLYNKILQIQQLQLYLKKINPHYVYKNTSLNLELIVLLLWILKYQKMMPNVVFKNKIILDYYL